MSRPAAMLLAMSSVGADRLLANAIPSLPALDMLLTQSLSDHADPKSSLGFLTLTTKVVGVRITPSAWVRRRRRLACSIRRTQTSIQWILNISHNRCLGGLAVSGSRR